MNRMQEKYQTIARKPKEESTEWVSADSQRKKSTQKKLQMPGTQDYQGSFRDEFSPAPTGTDDKRVNKMQLSEGFQKLPMNGTDDQYTEEHYDEFYSEVGGFAERSNYLDRT